MNFWKKRTDVSDKIDQNNRLDYMEKQILQHMLDRLPDGGDYEQIPIKISTFELSSLLGISRSKVHVIIHGKKIRMGLIDKGYLKRELDFTKKNWKITYYFNDKIWIKK